ncbi:contactin-associated protein-like 5 [Protopterus annectens]|uniref:contactin-associated protein-like 5 n=1 Tax=Protopterus annectens TaxID=7888 RepID=UPI001CFA0490|nr:contactin-associated protein-like 5 [Protopterus annectens]
MDSFLCRFYKVLVLLPVIIWKLGSAAINYNCEDPLVASLPIAAFDSSSELSGMHSPKFAKLNSRDGAGGWSPLVSNKYQWLQIDLRERAEITAVATQGKFGSSDWVTSYGLLFSDTGRNWMQYHQEDSFWVFTGNTNADSTVHSKLQHSVKARFIRFVPLQWNPDGGIGMRVEVYGCTYKSDVADFDGRTSLMYRFNQKSMSTVKDVISLKFKSMQSEGVLLHGEGQRGDYITLELQKGRLSLHMNLGDAKGRFSNSHTTVILGSLLDDQHWHSVLIERFNKQVNFTVDKHIQHFRTKGDSDYLDIDYELSFGGIPVPGKPGTFLKRNFQGCIENLYYNGVNIIDLAKRRKPQIYTVGNVTFSCSELQDTAITFTSVSDSYLLLPGTPSLDGLSVSFQFRTWNKDGLLLSAALFGKSGVLLLYLDRGILKLNLQVNGESETVLTTGSDLNDGLWHTVSMSARRHRIAFTVDNDATLAESATIQGQIVSGNNYYFGGCPPSAADSRCVPVVSGYQGCMRSIFIDNMPKDLKLVQRGSHGNFSELQIDVCGMKDRCLPNYCEHSGVCFQSWTTFYCDCSNTGYTGATCHNSVYEESCEVYRHKGNTSGFFYIDSDGSGPIKAMLVYCNITEDKAWTVIQHNNTEVTQVQGFDMETPYSMSFNYSGNTMEQLYSLINSAEHCQQETTYYCKKSRLFNSPSVMPFTWWVGRNNERHAYWGGSIPGIQQCACGLEENCLDIRFFCNCDADKEEWTNDTGLLSYKEHLPVTQIFISDTYRENSEAAYKIGPLQCYGDRNFWNAASFSSDSSYLHFPTLQAELSNDISFFFKTTYFSGVFLENLGVKGFVRLELKSPSEVAFSFDMGNGAREVMVKSPSLLNDNQWHYVKAERNIKEAVLQVDRLPRRTSEAPTNGHFRLQLNSQLFVGGAASRQKGFIGCIRFLQLNGVTLDLDERARMTPGVRPGCPGHCSSYGNLCHNGGKCIEKHNGYSCDCSSSAYDGPFCRTEVAALFKPGTSVTYHFQEPYPVTKNSSIQASSIYMDSAPSREHITFSFMTMHSPSLLMHVSSHHQAYMGVLLCQNGSLQIRYKLKTSKVPEVLTINLSNFSNGQLHQVKINREGRHLYVQVDHFPETKYNLPADADFSAIKSITLGKLAGNTASDPEVLKANSYGFIGCLSSVQYNQIAPLKMALRYSSTAIIGVQGHLIESHCTSSPGFDINTIKTTHSSSDHSRTADERKVITSAMQSDSAIIGGVIAVVIFIIVCIVAIMTRFFYHHKAPHRTNQVKEKEFPENLDNSLKSRTELQNPIIESKTEYFI